MFDTIELTRSWHLCGFLLLSMERCRMCGEGVGGGRGVVEWGWVILWMVVEGRW